MDKCLCPRVGKNFNSVDLFGHDISFFYIFTMTQFDAIYTPNTQIFVSIKAKIKKSDRQTIINKYKMIAIIKIHNII